MTACFWQNKFCDGNSVRSVRRFVLHVILWMVIFVLGFFFCKHLRRLSLVSDGGDVWRHFTSILLPDGICLVSYPQMLKTTGGRRGMTRNDKDEGCCYPTPQATNKRLDAFLPLQLGKKRKSVLTTSQWKTKANLPRNPKQRFSQVDSTNVPNPQHMETHGGKQNFQKFLCLPPKNIQLSKPPKKTVDFPAPWNKYCQTLKVPLSMVHQSQIDPNCICPQYEHQTMLRCPYHWSPQHHHVAKGCKRQQNGGDCGFSMFFFVVNWST